MKRFITFLFVIAIIAACGSAPEPEEVQGKSNRQRMLEQKDKLSEQVKQIGTTATSAADETKQDSSGSDQP